MLSFQNFDHEYTQITWIPTGNENKQIPIRYRNDSSAVTLNYEYYDCAIRLTSG